MVELMTSTLFSISTNIDNIPIGISYGIKKVHISIIYNLFISFITSIVTFLSMLVGSTISSFFNLRFANIIGSIFLILLGFFSIISSLSKRKSPSKHQKKDTKTFRKSTSISTKELLTIILSLSLNNIATGIAASITGINLFYTTICTFIFSSVFLYVGNCLGKKINNELVQKYSNLISSFIFIILGIIEIFI